MKNEDYRETSISKNLVRQWNGLRQRPKISHSTRHNLKVILSHYLNSKDDYPCDIADLLDDVYRVVRYEIRKATSENRRNQHREI